MKIMKQKKTPVVQVDKYDKYAEIGEMYGSKWRSLSLLVPSNFRMLCAILDVQPEKILMDFMQSMTYSVSKDAKEAQRRAARKFFLSRRYGQPVYSKKQIRKMFAELKAIRTTYDSTDTMNQEDKELFWKNSHMYTEFWFKRWFEKNSRKDNLSGLQFF